MDEIICPSCGQQMKLQKNFGCKPRGRKKKRYRVRRFFCSLCQIGRTLFSNGERDNLEAEEAQEEIENNYKQQAANLQPIKPQL